MPETFSHTEGALYIWTGTASATNSGTPLAYVEQFQFPMSRNWQSQSTINGTMWSYVAGRSAAFNGSLKWALADKLTLLFSLETAVHLKFEAVLPQGGSAGVYTFPAYIQTQTFVENVGQVSNNLFAGYGLAWGIF